MAFVWDKIQNISEEEIFRNSWSISFRLWDIGCYNDPQFETVRKTARALMLSH